MAETGGETDENDKVIPPRSNGQNWTKGRIYQFEFTDPADPTKSNFQVMFDGNDAMAPGYDILTNPDNLDTSLNSLMINEDRMDANRLNVTSPYNITKNAQILKVYLPSHKFSTYRICKSDRRQSSPHMETGNLGCFKILWRRFLVNRCSSSYHR